LRSGEFLAHSFRRVTERVARRRAALCVPARRQSVHVLIDLRLVDVPRFSIVGTFAVPSLNGVPRSPVTCSCDFKPNPLLSQLYLNVNNCPLQVSQGGESRAMLIMTGPWVASDHGVNANGVVTNKDADPALPSLPQGSTIILSPGFEDWGSITKIVLVR